MSLAGSLAASSSVAVGVGNSVGTSVAVGSGISVGVSATAGSGVFDGIGVSVGDGSGVAVGSNVDVGSGTSVGVVDDSDGTSVELVVGSAGTSVGVAVCVGDAVVGVLVAVGVSGVDREGHELFRYTGAPGRAEASGPAIVETTYFARGVGEALDRPTADAFRLVAERIVMLLEARMEREGGRPPRSP